MKGKGLETFTEYAVYIERDGIYAEWSADDNEFSDWEERSYPVYYDNLESDRLAAHVNETYGKKVVTFEARERLMFNGQVVKTEAEREMEALSDMEFKTPDEAVEEYQNSCFALGTETLPEGIAWDVDCVDAEDKAERKTVWKIVFHNLEEGE